MLCCGCCFCFCGGLACLTVTAVLGTQRFLTQHEALFPTIPCTGPVLGVKPPHHLQGCEMKGHTLGSFNFTEVIKHCGPYGDFFFPSDGSRASFLGDVSSGTLEPWRVPAGLAICLIEEGSFGVPAMVKTMRKKMWFALVFCLFMELGGMIKAARVFFFEHIRVNEDAEMRACPIASAGLLMVSILAVLCETSGMRGFLVACLLLGPVLAVCVSENAFDFAKNTIRAFGDGVQMQSPATESSPLVARASRQRPLVEPDPEMAPDASAASATCKADNSMWLGIQVGVLCGLVFGLVLTFGFAWYQPLGNKVF